MYKDICKKIYFGLLVLLLSTKALAQTINASADQMRGETVNGKKVAHLMGNVNFDQNGNTVSCDDALHDEASGELIGSGNVRINSSDGVNITGERLVYNSNSKMARVEGNVHLTDKGMELTTPWISYNTVSKIGWYGSGGKIVDGNQTLTSGSGTYNPNLSMLYFNHDVVLTHPDYTVKGDTLQYNSRTGTAYFFAYTEITDKENTILCNSGYYNTKTGYAFFKNNAAIINKENIIRADTLFYNRNTGIGKAYGKLWVKDTAQNIIIFGKQGEYRKFTKTTIVSGEPIAKQIEKNGDSLFLKADTFIYVDDSINKKRKLFAFHKASVYQKDFAGTCDSLTYFIEDSAFKLFGHPVLWNETSRMNADTVFIYLKNKKINTMQMRKNSFVTIKESETYFSQVKGKNFDNYFAQNKLKSVNVTDSCKSVYFIKEQDTAVTSANVVQCEKMRILLDSGKVSGVRFYTKPVGTTYPLQDLPAGKDKLEGFVWDEINIPEAEDFADPFEVPPLPSKENKIKNKLKRK